LATSQALLIDIGMRGCGRAGGDKLIEDNFDVWGAIVLALGVVIAAFAIMVFSVYYIPVGS
jgi:hypothetical protein